MNDDKKDYKVIALDLDGTLLTSEKKILPESITALTQARQRGVKVLIVTGRHHTTVKPFYRMLALDTPVLCCNGSYMYNYHNQSISAANPMTKNQSRQLLSLLRQNEISCLVYSKNAMLFEQSNQTIERWQRWSAQLLPEDRPELLQVSNYEDVINQTDIIWKFVTLAPEDQLIQFSKKIEPINLACEISWHEQMDIMQTGNSKGRLLQKWVTEQGFNMDQVIAFGDNFNDLSMLEVSGLGVAMANSSADIQAKADLIISDNESPGIAETIYQYVLN